MTHWTEADIPWDQFDPMRVDPEILKVVKAAAMVERNAADYGTYLANVFTDDPVFARAVHGWAREEIQHGDVLGRWAEIADPDFDFGERFSRFREGFRIPVESSQSIRGSRSGELVARCIVEVGTSSYYTALGEATEEPVLKAICQRIAADEFRHYKMFYAYLKRYLDMENPGRWRQVKVALGRIIEADDDELAYAYYAANGDGQPYERQRFAAAYAARAYGFYRPGIVQRGVSMTLKAVGLKPNGWFARLASSAVWSFLSWRRRRLAQTAI